MAEKRKGHENNVVSVCHLNPSARGLAPTIVASSVCPRNTFHSNADCTHYLQEARVVIDTMHLSRNSGLIFDEQ
jgi:hypothetical protein